MDTWGWDLPWPCAVTHPLLGIACLDCLTYTAHGSRDRQIQPQGGFAYAHSLRDLLIGVIASLLATAILRFLDSLELLK